MIKKGCLLGALLSISLLANAAEAKKTAPPRAKEASGDLAAMSKLAPNNKILQIHTCPSPAGGTCTITVKMGETCEPDRKPEHEYLKVNKKVSIVWELDEPTSKHWQFDRADGVKFDSGVAAPFDSKVHNPTRFKWRSKDTAAPGQYHYKIKLVSTKPGGPSCLIDPAIWI